MKFFNKKRGQAAIMVTITLIGIIALLALVVDTGRIFIEHGKLQRGVDAAVLAAAQDLPIGKDGSTEEIIEGIINSSLSANLNVDAQTYTKDDNLNEYMLFEEETEEVSITREADDISDEDVYSFDIQFITPANSIDGKKTVISLTASKVVKTRMATFLGYSEWVVSAQQIAIIGPIQTVPEILPLGILVDNDVNGKPKSLPLNEVVRISNTAHDSSSRNQLTYVPIYPLNRYNSNTGEEYTPFRGYQTPDYQDAHDVTLFGSGKNKFVYTSDIKNAQELRISSKESSDNVFLGICDGITDRIKTSVFESSVGCINVDESTAGDIDYNFTIGTSDSMYGYIEDPRMFILPVIQYSSNYTIGNSIKNRQREFKIVGFVLFFCEYAHYTSSPPTTEFYEVGFNEKEPPAMTELVGYFTTAVFEGPIDPTTRDYGISGIQYVSATDEKIFDIDYE